MISPNEMIEAIKSWCKGKFITEIPIGSDTVVGGVKADGTTTTIDSDGTIHATGSGGGTGTTDYNGLSNKPSINDVTLSGNKTLSDLGIQPEGNFVTEEELEQKGFITGISKEDVTEALGYTPPEQDTTYSEATTSKSGLMSADDKKKMGYTNVAYGKCPTSGADKIVTILGNEKWELKEGSIIFVFFTSDNSASNPTLNVNGTGAYNIVYDSRVITDSGLLYAGKANRTGMYVFNGVNYVFMGWSVDLDTTYTNPSLGNGYGRCDTAESELAKVVNLPNYSLVENGMVCVRFSSAVPAGSTMNINGKGARDIYYRRSSITDGIIKAGDVAVFIFNSSIYHLVAIDSALTPEFTEASERTNISSGEALSVIFGKVMKWFTDLKPHAFVAPITNLLTTVAGSALDATMGTELNNKIATNATAIEEVNSSLNNLGKFTVTSEITTPEIPYGTTTAVHSVDLTEGSYILFGSVQTTMPAQGSYTIRFSNTSMSQMQQAYQTANSTSSSSVCALVHVGAGETKTVSLVLYQKVAETMPIATCKITTAKLK